MQYIPQQIWFLLQSRVRVERSEARKKLEPSQAEREKNCIVFTHKKRIFVCVGVCENDWSERCLVALPPSLHSFIIACMYQFMCVDTHGNCIVGECDASVCGNGVLEMDLPYTLHHIQETNEVPTHFFQATFTPIESLCAVSG